MSDDKADTGIKTFSVGFTSAPKPEEISSAPRYRILIVGDFGVDNDRSTHRIAGRDVSELLAELRPTFAIAYANRLGTLPARLSEAVSLAALKDLRADKLLAQFSHFVEAKDAAHGGELEGLRSKGQVFDTLCAAASSRSTPAPPSARTETLPPVGREDDDGADDLDRLFSMVDAPDDKSPAGDTAAAAVQAFLSDAVGSASLKPTQSEPVQSVTSLLDQQAAAILSDPRLCHVIENWLSLRLFLNETNGDKRPDVDLLHVPFGATAEEIGSVLAGENGALAHELYDLVFFANRQNLGNDVADRLRAVADAAAAFDGFALVTLDAEIAGQTPEGLASYETPQSLFEAPGFETFNSIRIQQRSEHMALFWNDALLHAQEGTVPARLIPSAWIALIMIVGQQMATGWPALPANTRIELSDLDLTIGTSGGRDVAHATRVVAKPDSAAGLAAAGIAALCGENNKPSVYFSHTPTVRAAQVGGRYRPITARLVLARLNTLLQGVLMEHLDREATADDAAAELRIQFAALSKSLVHHPQFNVSAVLRRPWRHLHRDGGVHADRDSRRSGFLVPDSVLIDATSLTITSFSSSPISCR